MVDLVSCFSPKHVWSSTGQCAAHRHSSHFFYLSPCLFPAVASWSSETLGACGVQCLLYMHMRIYFSVSRVAGISVGAVNRAHCLPLVWQWARGQCPRRLTVSHSAGSTRGTEHGTRRLGGALTLGFLVLLRIYHFTTRALSYRDWMRICKSDSAFQPQVTFVLRDSWSSKYCKNLKFFIFLVNLFVH